ncbi:TPR repeat [Desulfovibrio sp. DV]|uniref:tetratricopeptide repeat protein n=1 Tax=Desulfovibrio sp. DV TaxID=1844708 RepID=UPI00094B8EA6|nr:hypothetical protein [Desulfovibrio sp. DV]OLN28824.1 TPR repeat [Desulfovibrio sp. DV]
MGHARNRYALGNALPRRRGRALLAVALLTGWLLVWLATAGVGLAAKAGDGAANVGSAVPVAGESVNERLTRMELEIRQLREEQAAKAAEIEMAKTNAGNALATLESHKDRISDAHSRVSDVNFSITLSSAILSLLFAGVVAVGGVLTYQKAVEEARSGVNRWFEEEKDKLHTIIDQFIIDSYNKIRIYEKEAKKQLDDHIKDLDSKHHAAIDSLKIIQSKNLGPIDDSEREELTELADTTKEKPENTFTSEDWSAKAFAAYYAGDLSNAADYWLKSASTKDTTSLNAANSLINRGVTLGKLKRPQEELEAYDTVIARFGSDTGPEIREEVAMAMFNKGVTLGQLKEKQEELEAYDSIIARFSNDTEPGIREPVAKTMVNRGVTLGQLKGPQEELEAYDAVIARFGNDTEPGIREQVAKAMFNRGLTLGQLKRPQEKLDAYDAVIARFGNDTEPGIRKQVAEAFSSRSFALLGLYEYDKALTASEEALRRFLESDKNAFSDAIASAMANRSAALLKLGRAPESLAGCEEILTRYKQSADSFKWLAPFAEAMAIKADALDALDRHDEAQTTCDAMVAEFGKSDDADVLEEVTKGLREAAERARARNDATRLAHYEETLKKPPQSD